jgi:pimeloyl-ACP methyl ester carboxylesterase
MQNEPASKHLSQRVTVLGGAHNEARVKTTVTLARWLGPWADPKRRPEDIAIADDNLDGMRVRVFSPRGRARRAYLIAPGLHYAGADDPRMDRFCRILAAAGHVVVAPYIPDYLHLTPNDNAKRDFERAFHAMPRWSSRKPVLFSISFGSLLAFAVAAKYPARIDRLVIFGGYADFREMMRFCLTGEIEGGRKAIRDPLNQPVVLMNLLDHMECADRPALFAAWRRFVEATWGRAELKHDNKHVPIAEELAATVPANIRDLFLVGVGARPGASSLGLDALTRFDDRQLDPRPYLPRITSRVDLVHGADDDVIPWEHSPALAKLMPNADVRCHITGVYGHTGTTNAGAVQVAREVVTLVRVLRAMS